jgi:hypothetical protein
MDKMDMELMEFKHQSNFELLTISLLIANFCDLREILILRRLNKFFWKNKDKFFVNFIFKKNLVFHLDFLPSLTILRELMTLVNIETFEVFFPNNEILVKIYPKYIIEMSSKLPMQSHSFNFGKFYSKLFDKRKKTAYGIYESDMDIRFHYFILMIHVLLTGRNIFSHFGTDKISFLRCNSLGKMEIIEEGNYEDHLKNFGDCLDILNLSKEYLLLYKVRDHLTKKTFLINLNKKIMINLH